MEQPKIVDILYSKIKQFPVTSLKFIDNYILAGHAGDLLIYFIKDKNFSTSKKICSVEVFPSNNIYGIVNNGNNVLVFGEKKVAVLSGADLSRLAITSSWSSEDWIKDGTWIEDNEIVLLAAHNVLLRYAHGQSPKLLDKVVSIEQCLLYSGKILGSKWEDLIVIAGTAFQEVIVWSPNVVQSKTEVPLIHRLIGHKGVVFSVTYNEETQCIASTSDDRTLRVWAVTFPETRRSVTKKWAHSSIRLSFSAFGHTARVWKSIFTPNGWVVTIGEDSQICFWDKNGNLLDKWEHTGDLRCLDYCDDYIAVGGNGITVRSLWPFVKVITIELSRDISYGVPRRVVLNSHGCSVISTDRKFMTQHNGYLFTSKSGLNERFHSYCILSISPCRKFIILGGILGDIALYSVSHVSLHKLRDASFQKERICSFAWPSSKSILVCGESGIFTHFKMNKSHDDFFSIEKVQQFILPHSKERWITCAMIFENFLICGDRMGSVHLYLLTSEELEPLDSYLKLHGIKGVTEIKYIDGVIYSIGRDGTLRELTIADNKIYLISTLKLPMDWAIGVMKNKTYGLIVAGFHGSKFVLWSVDERSILLSTECGGGHRSFDYMIDDFSENLLLTFIRMKTVKFLCCPLRRLTHHTILAGYHTKPINCACLLPMANKKVTMLTGGEDNLLKLCKFDDKNYTGYNTYISHISSVRALKHLDGVVVSAGARAQIIVWNINENLAGELCLREMKSHMVREENHKSWKDSEPSVEPDIRYMDLEIVNTDGIFTLFGACSDGILRIFSYDKDTHNLTLLKSLNSQQGCLLKVISYKCNNKLGIITGDTKGTVTFWPPELNSPPTCNFSLHSAGINAIDQVQVKNNLILGTGSDSGSLALTVFSMDKNMRASVEFNLTEHCHTCQISGIKITKDYVLSAGLDQKLCVFKWTFDGFYLKTTLLGNFITSIPDIHGILVWTHKEKDLEILVYGCGFQVIGFQGSSLPS